MNCQVCKMHNTLSLGKFRPYLDYSVEIYECLDCGCRFSFRDNSVHEKLHENKNSTYNIHNQLASDAKLFFDRKDLVSLRDTLSRQEKNRHVINVASSLPKGAKILEIGCSQGYLTSWFIAQGYKIFGTDVSRTAIEKAQSLFGDHFKLVSDPSIEENAPYDYIFHVGTIGCVENPVELTRYWISLLKPGGKIAFNAPNKSLADRLNRLWPQTTTPPDLVTLFPPEFWKIKFEDIAVVDVQELNLSKHQALQFRFLPSFFMHAQPYLFKRAPFLRFIQKGIFFVARKLLFIFSSDSQSDMPAEFGVMVTLTKRL